MKIYSAGSHGRGVIFVSPGYHHPEKPEWIDSQLKKPRMFTITFADGVAEVESDIGIYMIKRGLAQNKPVLLPPKIAAKNAEKERDRLSKENATLHEQLKASRLLLAS